MKFLQELLEADNPGQKVAWYDLFMAHRPGAGNEVNKAVFSFEQLDKLSAGDEDDMYDVFSGEHNLWGASEVVGRWPEIKKVLLSKGTWVEEWEEGIVALSIKGMKTAGDEARKVLARYDGDDDEDF